MECKPLPLDLRAFCLRLRDEMRSSANHSGSIEVTAQHLAGEAAADESLLRHIFTNLLSNALKYSDPGGTVEFSVVRRERDAIFEVQDRGIGIPEEDLDELFQTFRRGGNVGERPGTGLGLVIVKRCVELHGGAIGVRNREGGGTTVTVRLPLFTTRPGSRKKVRGTRSQNQRNKKKKSRRSATAKRTRS